MANSIPFHVSKMDGGDPIEGAIPINLTGQITPDPVDNPMLEELPGEATLEDVISHVNEILVTLRMYGVLSSGPLK